MAALLTACAGPGGGAGETPVRSVAEAYGAMMPATLRIHPLSRLEQDSSGAWRIACHLELLDAAGHGVKWLGSVRVELLRPNGETGTRQAVYEQDLSAPAANARAFDWVTRTYVVLLADLPAWSTDTAPGDTAAALRAEFSFPGPDGAPVTIQDTHVIRRDR